jgi:hypothetical protein
MRKTLLRISSHIHYHLTNGKLQVYDLLEMDHLELDFSSMMTILTLSSDWIYEIFSLMNYHEEVPNPT